VAVEVSKYRKKKKLGSYPSFSVVFSITLALFVSGLFGLLLVYAKNLSEVIRQNIEVQIYLDKFLTENERIRISKTLESKPYVLKDGNYASIAFISKEEAAKKFIEETGEDFVNFLGENPLHDAITIKIALDYQTDDKLAYVAKDLQTINGVFEVNYSQNLISEINRSITKISLVLLGIASVLILAVVILINNTIKLALFSQRFLIRSMQLVGATTGFIRKPFLIRSMIYGLLGGLIASIGLWSLIQFAQTKVVELSMLQNNQEIFILFGVLVIIGILLGLICTYQSMRKYMKLSLDELY